METPSIEVRGRDPERSRPPASLVIKIFVGPDGIRAGWRLLVFLALALFLMVVLGSIVPVFRSGHVRGTLAPAAAAFAEGSAFLALLLSAFVMSRVEKRSLAQYALPGRGILCSQFWYGALWGFCSVTILLALMRVAHGFSFGSLALEGRELVYFAGLWALAFAAVAMLEEFLFRGYALFTLSTGMGFWPAAILLSICFGAIHLQNPGETWVGVAAAGLIGLFFCFTVRRTGSLWFAIGLHFMWDYSESFLYSVPDSGVMIPGHLLSSSFHGLPWLTGGTAGPEGSVFVLPLIGTLFGVFDRIYRHVRFPLADARRTFSSEPARDDAVRSAPQS